MFLVSGIVACLYFYGDYRVWLEYDRLRKEYGNAPLEEDAIKVMVDQPQE
jgi:hypothetical protein